MSKSHCSSTQVLHDIQALPQEDIVELYGIEVNEDGSIFDPMENRTFTNLLEWATFIDQQEADENYGTMVKLGGKVKFDDD